MLNSLKEILDRVSKLLQSDKDRYNGLLKEARVQFDKYLRLYAKDSKQLKRQRRDWDVQEKTELASFK